MKVYISLTALEVNLVIGELQHATDKRIRDVGDRLSASVRGDCDIDMELVGTDDTETYEEDDR